ncbi:uncharacterized protein LOC111357123 [Spodoptera litura]|uniref:Uncharacterized protein LOC111357123 n=1 Tax=Spodoptera litura TaxID=69820 RepID=A0A9J7EG89_SPOLT|nr:uncharacterized protein LOC111357123 [Spodoptera litura]
MAAVETGGGEQFDFDTSSLLSLTTGVKYEDPRFHLNLVQKKEFPSERPIIPSTKFERLTFFRGYTSSQSKTEIVASHHVELNSFLWFYAFNVFFKSLPHGFVHFFLASYAPEEHSFIAKMVPFSIGLKYLFIITGFLELMLAVDVLVLMFHYTTFGIIAKNPWNRYLQVIILVNIILRKIDAADLEMLAESITAPSVVHILAARSEQKINPAQDSTAMVVSNALIYIFKGLLSVKVKINCEDVINTYLPPITFNEHSWFYLWPMLFQQFYLGDIFSVLYTVFNMVTDICIIMVTNLCVIETIVYEWPKFKRWSATIVISITGIIMYCITTIDTRAILWVYAKGIATVGEIVFLYLWYPVGRLIDDFTFHYGTPPTQLRILSLRLVPIYYITWNLIMRPVPKWGPRDFTIRQLRKQFDSRYFIASDVPRLLSHYLLSKRETKVYKVDVRYDVQRRSTVNKAVGFGITSMSDKRRSQTNKIS